MKQAMYELGQEVYFLDKSNFGKGVIQSIHYHAVLPDTIIFYGFYNPSCEIAESRVFSTPQDVIKAVELDLGVPRPSSNDLKVLKDIYTLGQVSWQLDEKSIKTFERLEKILNYFGETAEGNTI